MHSAGRAPHRFSRLPVQQHFLAILVIDVLSTGLQVDHDAVDNVLVNGGLLVRFDSHAEDFGLVVVDVGVAGMSGSNREGETETAG